MPAIHSFVSSYAKHVSGGLNQLQAGFSSSSSHADEEGEGECTG